MSQKSAPLELDMFIEMKKYFQTDVFKITNYVNKCILTRNAIQSQGNIQVVQNINKTIQYLNQRKNFALNCIKFLENKINEWRKKKD